MGNDILVIIMVAFGLLANVMFVLFFVYLKKYYGSKHIEEDYKKELDEKIDDDSVEEEIEKIQESTPIVSENPKETISFKEMNDNIKEVEIPKDSFSNNQIEDDMEFVPIKKK